MTNLLAGQLISSDALHERDGMGIQLVSLVGLVNNGKWDTETQPFQIADLESGGGRGEEVWGVVSGKR